jgi:LacI family transcriptional regulator
LSASIENNGSDSRMGSDLAARRTGRPPTLVDVARLAGVSKGAVAAVMRGSDSTAKVSESTRQRIMEAARELRFRPNALARGLNGVRLKSLGLSFPTTPYDHIITDPYCSSVLRGIINAAVPRGYNVTHFHRTWHDAEQSAASFRSQGLDGFLIVAPLAGSDMVSGLSSLGIPLVVISTSSEVHSVPAVDVDNEKIVRLALDHLIGLGHRRIAHLYLSGLLQSFDSTARRDSFVRIMAAAGILVPPEYLRAISGPGYMPGIYDQTRILLSVPEPPTAVFTTNDFMARNVLEAAAEIGVRVSEQLSVVGVDDNPVAAIPNAITTIRQPLVRMGEEAARMLIEQIEGEDVPARTYWFEPELVVRSTTAPPGGE